MIARHVECNTHTKPSLADTTLQVVAGELLEAKGRAVQTQRVAFVRVTVLDGQTPEVGPGIAGSIGDEADIVGVVTHIGVVL